MNSRVFPLKFLKHYFVTFIMSTEIYLVEIFKMEHHRSNSEFINEAVVLIQIT